MAKNTNKTDSNFKVSDDTLCAVNFALDAYLDANPAISEAADKMLTGLAALRWDLHAMGAIEARDAVSAQILANGGTLSALPKTEGWWKQGRNKAEIYASLLATRKSIASLNKETKARKASKASKASEKAENKASE